MRVPLGGSARLAPRAPAPRAPRAPAPWSRERCCYDGDDGDAKPAASSSSSSRPRRAAARDALLATASSRRAALLTAAAAAASSILQPPLPALAAGFPAFRTAAARGSAAQRLREKSLLKQLGGAPARFGSGRPAKVYMAESMLLSGLPVECPPLDLLQVEMEKFYILQPTTVFSPMPSPSAPPPPASPPPLPATLPPSPPFAPYAPLPPPPPPPDASSRPSADRVDWAKLEAARRSSLEAAIESKPLFRLFFGNPDIIKGSQLLDLLASRLRELEAPVAAKDVDAVCAQHLVIMRLLVAIGDLVVSKFPYVVSKAIYCEGLPRLLGRACVQCVIERPSSSPEFKVWGGTTKLTIVVDGFAAPITAGSFIDLVQRGFYNGLPIGRNHTGCQLPVELEVSGKVLVSGQPADLGGNITGFVDPRTGSYRTLPVEILPLGASEPTYPLSAIYDDEKPPPSRSGGPAGVAAAAIKQPPALPFRAAGSLGMVHSLNDPDDASSEFFITTAPLSRSADGAITTQLDSQYTLFGFVLEGVDDLPKICTGDVIRSMTVIDGAKKLVRPNFNPRYTTRRREGTKRDYQMLGEQNEGLGQYDGGAIPASVPLKATPPSPPGGKGAQEEEGGPPLDKVAE
jgi:cyclophilin family peptidyl-prolyl cis-trans isomerase